MSDKASYFLFISLVWAGITVFIVYDWYEGVKEKIAWNNFVRAGGCIAMDQMGRCYDAKEYQALLEEEKNQEIISKEVEELAEFNIITEEAKEEMLNQFK